MLLPITIEMNTPVSDVSYMLLETMVWILFFIADM